MLEEVEIVGLLEGPGDRHLEDDLLAAGGSFVLIDTLLVGNLILSRRCLGDRLDVRETPEEIALGRGLDVELGGSGDVIIVQHQGVTETIWFRRLSL